MTVIIRNRLDLGRLVNFGAHKGEAIHRWFCYRHSFSPELVRVLVNHFGLPPRSRVLDPFCGSGTTLLACQQLGLECEGVDALPLSVFVARVKTRQYRKTDLIKAFEQLTFSMTPKDWTAYMTIPIVRKAFAPEVLKALLGLKDEIDSITTDRKSREFLKLCWYGILEQCSNTVKDGAFLRIVEKQVSPTDVRVLFAQRFHAMLSDVTEVPRARVRALRGDSRRLPPHLKLAPYDAVITSPPYPNRHDYTRIYALELILGGTVTNNDDLKRLRYNTLRSHVEARRQYSAADYTPPIKLVRLLQEIQRSGTYDRRNITMLEGYFEDMYMVLNQLFSRLRPGGRVAMVVSDVRFSGITIPVGELLCELAASLGYTNHEMWILRYRGNTPQQLRSFTKERTAESVVMFTRP